MQLRAAVDCVEVAHHQPVERPRGLDGVAQQHGVRVPAPETALPTAVIVVRFGQRVERDVMRGQRAGAVARHVGARDAQAQDGRADAMASLRWPMFETLISGDKRELVAAKVLNAEEMRRGLVTGRDLDEAVRKKTGDEVSPIDRAVLERDGTITVKPGAG